MTDDYEFDVALSFAGEDRAFASELAERLLHGGVRVFYDRYAEADLWGKDLYQHLQSVYRDKAKYCVVIVSRHYADKLWTRHELKQAQARAFRENREYILPVRLDDTELPGVNATVGYVDANSYSIGDISSMVIEKLRTHGAVVLPEACASSDDVFEDEPELLDLRADMDDALQSAMVAIARIGELSTKGAATDREWHAAAQKLLASGSRDARMTQALVNQKAANFAERTKALAPLVIAFREASGRFFDLLNRIVDVQIQEGRSTPEEMRNGLRIFAQADIGAKGARDVYAQIAEAARALATPTRDFKRQRNEFVEQVEEFTKAVDRWLALSASARSRLDSDPKCDSGQ